MAYGPTGQLWSASQERHLDNLADAFAKVLRRASRQQRDQSVQAVAQAWAASVRLPPEDQALLQFILHGRYETEYAGDASALSSHWFDEARAFAGEDALFARGFGTLADYLASGLRIECKQVVRSMDWGDATVRVQTDEKLYQADAAIVTLPLGVLKAGAVQFSPPLPVEKSRAIQALGMGLLNKCYLRFEKVFWPAQADWLEHIPATVPAWTQWVSLVRAASLPVLLGFNAGQTGREMEGLSDAETVASAMQTLRTLFGQGIPEPLDYQVTRWGADPFALGAYSFNALGAHPAMRDALAAPLGAKVFFAGEATMRHDFGSAHGALLSGQRAAREVRQGVQG